MGVVRGPDEGIGCGFTEASAEFSHTTWWIRDGKIANYHPYPPTPWNASPRDSYGTPVRTRMPCRVSRSSRRTDRDHFKGIDIMRTVRSFGIPACRVVVQHVSRRWQDPGVALSDAVRDRGGSMEQSADYWRGAGERIETLLQANAGAGPVVRDRAEQLVREVVQLYGAALERTVALADPATMDAMVRDDLVSSLLLVHGLHPHDVETRVRTAALDSVRPYLGSHGGDVELIEVADGVVRLRLLGSCNSCPSGSSVTLETAVQDAVQAAAPETTGIDVETPDPHEVKSGVISVEFPVLARSRRRGRYASGGGPRIRRSRGGRGRGLPRVGHRSAGLPLR